MTREDSETLRSLTMTSQDMSVAETGDTTLTARMKATGLIENAAATTLRRRAEENLTEIEVTSTGEATRAMIISQPMTMINTSNSTLVRRVKAAIDDVKNLKSTDETEGGIQTITLMRASDPGEEEGAKSTAMMTQTSREITESATIAIPMILGA